MQELLFENGLQIISEDMSIALRVMDVSIEGDWRDATSTKDGRTDQESSAASTSVSL